MDCIYISSYIFLIIVKLLQLNRSNFPLTSNLLGLFGKIILTPHIKPHANHFERGGCSCRSIGLGLIGWGTLLGLFS